MCAERYIQTRELVHPPCREIEYSSMLCPYLHVHLTLPLVNKKKQQREDCASTVVRVVTLVYSSLFLTELHHFVY